MFSAEFPADFISGGIGFATGGVVINESAAREPGWTPARAIGGRVQSSTDISYMVVADTVENARLTAQPIMYSIPENATAGTVWSIVVLFTAYFAMNRWLENFAYRMDLTPLIFIGSRLIALCIAWVAVGGTAAKAANAKPVLALRYE